MFTRTLKSLCLALAVIAVGLLGAPRADAAGLLIADGGLGGVLEIKEHDVQVTINNGIAVTKVDQVFHNTEKRQVEALYTFPVPKGASVANFSMWINGKEMVGEVLEKQRAREIYNSYKQVRRDPGLLEQVDYRTFEMRIFPIGPDADQKVQITYYQELDYDHDTATYVYPLATVTRKGVDARTTGKFAISVRREVRGADRRVGKPAPRQRLRRRQTLRRTIGRPTSRATGGSLARDVVLACHVRAAADGHGPDHLKARRRGRLLLPDAHRRPGSGAAAGQAWTTSSCWTSPAAWPPTASCRCRGFGRRLHRVARPGRPLRGHDVQHRAQHAVQPVAAGDRRERSRRSSFLARSGRGAARCCSPPSTRRTATESGPHAQRGRS